LLQHGVIQNIQCRIMKTNAVSDLLEMVDIVDLVTAFHLFIWFSF